MNRESQTVGGEKKKDSEGQQKGETEPVILSSLVAFNFPFLTIKMSEINRQLQ